MTRVFVFTNHKGGVGKSTSATNTALGITGHMHQLKESGILMVVKDQSKGYPSP